ncbi:SGNH/GDSL hydrolase family protein [candidate division CSSED10-310 bacterium]|uniref:SGNH/GDSL hydrolase family protein n=1 Tax=candidate division CSSED10-310 bacterium TaxID=2855610 RepID=A0ABV6Z2Z6_UNCC1
MKSQKNIPGEPRWTRKLFFSLLIFVSLIVLAELIITGAAINDHYRRSRPSFLVQEDVIFLHRVRANLDIEAPRYAHLQLNLQKTLSKTVADYFHVYTNSLGLREKNDVPHPNEQAEYRIICYGDSVTFGWGSNYDEAYPHLLQKELGTHYTFPIRVINAGQPGFSSYQSVLFYKEVLAPLKPDLVISAFGHNDHHLGIKGYQSAREKFVENTTGLGKWRMILRGFNTFLLWERLVTAVTGRVRFLLNPGQLDDLDGPGSLVEYEENMSQLALEISRQGALNLFLTQPMSIHDSVYDRYNETLRALCATQKLPLVDLVPPFDRALSELTTPPTAITPPPNFLFWDNVHPTAVGNALIANEICDYLHTGKLDLTLAQK